MLPITCRILSDLDIGQFVSLGWASVSFGVFGNSNSEGTLLGASGFLAEVVFSVLNVSDDYHPNLLLVFAEETIWSPYTFLCSWADD